MAQGNHRLSRSLPTLDPVRIRTEYLRGESVGHLARRYRCRTVYVSDALRSAGIDPVATGSARAGRVRRGFDSSRLRSKPNLTHVTELEWAYAAGIFDGEGCLTTFRNGRYRLIVSQNGRELAEWFEDRFGGVARCSREAGVLTTKAGVPLGEHWQWYMGGQLAVRAVLEGWQPFLIVKKSVVDQAITDLEGRYR